MELVTLFMNSHVIVSTLHDNPVQHGDLILHLKPSETQVCSPTRFPITFGRDGILGSRVGDELGDLVDIQDGFGDKSAHVLEAELHIEPSQHGDITLHRDPTETQAPSPMILPTTFSTFVIELVAFTSKMLSTITSKSGIASVMFSLSKMLSLISEGVL